MRPSSVKIEEIDINTQTPSVRDGVEESVKKEVESKESNHKKKLGKPPSPTIVSLLERCDTITAPESVWLLSIQSEPVMAQQVWSSH
ncbi:hypothetical protein PVK06_043773 [Gossypium arboreum]|uniref:Uncharacterized protein n=1 Tax=Gossypium arboreum TaxID=29729 RepID=A0ABR0MPE6_GOSAR|nr:hypothetical protein PVK06_043773 [Gossypium arboreum]